VSSTFHGITPGVAFGKPGPFAALVAAGSTLPTGLVSWWNLDEESGVRYDAVGSNDLTDGNTVLYAAGKIGNAASFVKANSERLFSAVGGAVNLLNDNYTYAFWMKNTSTTGYQFPLSRANDAGFRRETGASTIRFFVGATFTATTSFSQDEWVFVAGWIGDDDKPTFSVNDGTPIVGAAATRVYNSSRLFLGTQGTTNYYDGELDLVGVWNRVLTAAEITELYNTGAGKDYPF